MILLSAEAILASSTSKFVIEIPRIDDEDFKSSTESTISTSLIHCIPSVGNCEQVHTSVLNLIFQQTNVAGEGNLSKEIRNLESLLVCSIIIWRISLTEDDRIFGWRSRLASQIMTLFWPFTLSPLWMNEAAPRMNSLIQFLRITCWRRRIWNWKNVSRYTMCVPNAWRPFSAARRYERMPQHAFRSWMRWEGHWSTGNVGISTAHWFSILKILRIVHTICFIL